MQRGKNRAREQTLDMPNKKVSAHCEARLVEECLGSPGPRVHIHIQLPGLAAKVLLWHTLLDRRPACGSTLWWPRALVAKFLLLLQQRRGLQGRKPPTQKELKQASGQCTMYARRCDDSEDCAWAVGRRPPS